MLPKTPTEKPFLSFKDASKIYGIGKRCEHNSEDVFRTFSEEEMKLGALLRIADASEKTAAALRRIEESQLRMETTQKRQRNYASGLQTRIKKLEAELAAKS